MTRNFIDLKNDCYLRENTEFQFKINFKDNSFKYTLKSIDKKMEGILGSSSIEKNNPIILKYNLDNEEKTIIIHLL